jgi:hypothetical protein
MKTLKYFFFVALGSVLMAADCSNKDTEFYNDVYATTSDLVVIELENVYAVNDPIWLNSDNFSRYIDEPGQANPLDVYKTTGGAMSFNFTYLLEREVSENNWQLVTLGDNLIVERGIATETELYVAAWCVYNPTTEHYEFRNGLRLTETGNYRISFGYNSVETKLVELRSDSFNNNLFLNLNSINSQLDGAGYHNFTVTD